MHFRGQKMNTPRHNVPRRFMISFLIKTIRQAKCNIAVFPGLFLRPVFQTARRVKSPQSPRFRGRSCDSPLAEKLRCVHNIHSLSNYKTCKPGFVFSNHKCRTLYAARFFFALLVVVSFFVDELHKYEFNYKARRSTERRA